MYNRATFRKEVAHVHQHHNNRSRNQRRDRQLIPFRADYGSLCVYAFLPDLPGRRRKIGKRLPLALQGHFYFSNRKRITTSPLILFTFANSPPTLPRRTCSYSLVNSRAITVCVCSPNSVFISSKVFVTRKGDS